MATTKSSTAKTSPSTARPRKTQASTRSATKTKAPVKPAQAKPVSAPAPQAKPPAPPAKAVKTNGAAKAGKAAKPKKPQSAAKPDKARKPELALVRDSFTMPRVDHDLIATLKRRSVAAGKEVKKSELLRAGLHLLAAMDVARLLATLDQVVPLKQGRPKKGK
jgi:hypothetical protein